MAHNPVKRLWAGTSRVVFNSYAYTELQTSVPIDLTSGQHNDKIIPLQQGKEGVFFTLWYVNNGNTSSL